MTQACRTLPKSLAHPRAGFRNAMAWPSAASRKAPSPPSRPRPSDPWPCLQAVSISCLCALPALFGLPPGCRTSAPRRRPARCWHLVQSTQQQQQEKGRLPPASRCPAFLQDHLRLPSIRRKHSVADEAITVAHHDRLLADQLAHGLSSSVARAEVC